jgi:hypothetical protein
MILNNIYMENVVKHRLKAYLEKNEIKDSDFCRTICVSQGYISGMRKSIQPDKLKSIAINYPSLNIGWLLTGEGDMLNIHIQTDGLLGTDNKSASTNIDFLLNMLNRQEQQLSSQQNAIAEKDKTIAKKEDIIAKKEDIIAERDRTIASQHRTIEALSLKTAAIADDAKIAGAGG